MKSDKKSNKKEEDKTENKPLAEYRETIESSTEEEIKAIKSQKKWRDVESIEKKVDTLHIIRVGKTGSEVDKTVDRLIKKNKKK